VLALVLVLAAAVAGAGCGRLGFDGDDAAPDAEICVSTVDVTSVGAGQDFACARLADESLACWGDNTLGQLGDGTTISRAEAAPPSGLGAVDAYALGVGHACAIRGGDLFCWGRNEVGQLGAGDDELRLEPTAVAALPITPVGVAAGGMTTCAWDAAGVVYCWGQHQGVAMDTAFAPRLLPGLPAIIGAAMGTSDRRFSASHGCLLAADRAAWCFGYNEDGQLGDGTTTNSPTPVQVTGGGTFAALAAGDTFTCGRTSGGGVSCWGSNDDGQLGDGTRDGRSAPGAVAVTGVVDLRAAGETACALDGDGAVFCWGDNDQGQLGRPGPDATTPVRVDVPPARAIAVGATTSCAIGVDGVIRCWGGDRAGLAGGEATARALTVPGLTGVDQISAGADTTCVHTTDDTIHCWGRNSLGQLGDGSTTDRASPVAADLAAGATHVSVHGSHACARHASGAVSCWGENGVGQVSPSASGAIVAAPIVVTEMSAAATSVATGGGFSCATVAGAPPWCWGYTSEGRLGLPASMNVLPPTESHYPALDRIVAGNNHSCGITPAAELYCSGRDNEGQIGVGGNSGDVYDPLLVTGAATVVSVAAGQLFTCAAKTTGVALCWGENNHGQIGNGGRAAEHEPVALPLSGVVEVAAGIHHACARSTAGSVWCWGANGSGQLGDNTFASSTTPVAATELTGATHLALGESHTCAVMPDTTVRCVGNFSFGQLGDGTPPRVSPSPAKLTCP
jgi:alpha-tubulin suppressor-like RCC1 family protein